MGRPSKNQGTQTPVVQTPQPAQEQPKAKPAIHIRAQPITAPFPQQLRQSNQVIVVNLIDGKQTPMGRIAAERLVRKNPKMFKIQ